MNTNTTTLFLNIADCVISCEFEENEATGNKKNIREFIKSNYSGFLCGDKVSVNLRIVFSAENAREIRHVQKRKKYFLILFEYESDSVVRTYRTISDYEFQIVLREALFRSLKNKEAVLLHGSSNIIDGRAYVYTGDSGAGKSTLVSILSPVYRPLADDTVLIVKKKDRYVVYQTPFFEKINYEKKHSAGYTLGGIFFLKKNRECSLSPVKDKTNLASIFLRQLYATKPYYGHHMKTAIKMISQFPHFYFFRFTNKEMKLRDFIRKTPLFQKRST